MPARSRRLKLFPNLVPAPLWEISAFRLLKRGAAWKRIRSAAFSKTAGRCSICGITPPSVLFRDPRLYCHEVWHYDDRKAVATLREFQILCAGCSSVKHMGRTSAVGYLDQALAHLARVNGISKAAARRVFNLALDTWKERSQKTWNVTVSQDLLVEYPELRALVGRGAGPSPTEASHVE